MASSTGTDASLVFQERLQFVASVLHMTPADLVSQIRAAWTSTSSHGAPDAADAAKEIHKLVDHTCLKPTAGRSDYDQLVEECLRHGFASVCVPPSWVPHCIAAAAHRPCTVCTVVGFPLGYATTACKVFEAKEAQCEGAREIDMVVNQGWVAEERYDRVLQELKAMRDAVPAPSILKVIFETCNLKSAASITDLCILCAAARTDFVKTSTGFGSRGCSDADLEAMQNAREHLRRLVEDEPSRTVIAPSTAAITAFFSMKIKASGGIRDLTTAMRCMRLGADRLGTSSGVSILKELHSAPTTATPPSSESSVY